MKKSLHPSHLIDRIFETMSKLRANPKSILCSLLDMLEQFSSSGLNLIRIESRPVGDRLSLYRFNIDVESPVMDSSDKRWQVFTGLVQRFAFLVHTRGGDQKRTASFGNNQNLHYSEAIQWLEAIRNACKLS